MSMSKIMTLTVLIALVLGMVAIDSAVAGEQSQGRNVYYMVKQEPVKVGDEEGHIIAVFEGKGILTHLGGKSLCDGCALRDTGLIDINLKTAQGSAQGYTEATDRDGDKFYYSWKGKQMGPGYWEADWTIVKGTGKFEGIKGKGTWSTYLISAEQWYSDWEVEVELPGQ